MRRRRISAASGRIGTSSGLKSKQDIERIFGVVTELIARRVHFDLCIDTIAAQDTLPFRERRGRYAPDARRDQACR